ncbi:AAA family ATPase [Acidovorax temperans]|jgi:predicted ATPase
MKLYIDAIGKVVNSTIELNSLTLIAGENDTGKSTIGKVLFAIVQAFSKFPLVVQRENQVKLRRDLEQLYIELRRHIDLGENNELAKVFSFFRSEASLSKDIHVALLRNLAVDVLKKNELTPINRHRVMAALKNFDDELPDGEERVITKHLLRALKAEFAGQIKKKNSHHARIEISDGATKILEVSLEDNRIVDFKESGPLGLRDATFVDGPSIIQYFPGVSHLNSLGENNRSRRWTIPYHVVDLGNKLQGVKETIDLLTTDKSVNLFNVFNGGMRYDDDHSGFVLSKDSFEFPANNVASGIKAIAVVDMLQRGEFLGSDTLLVLDEPETNLHPTWQVQYARAICELVKTGTKILVTTHSPYMVEAIRTFAPAELGPKFYFSHHTEKGSVEYKDTDGDITEILQALAQPMFDLAGGDVE